MDAKIAGLFSELAYHESTADIDSVLSSVPSLAGWSILPGPDGHVGYQGGTGGAFTVFIKNNDAIVFAFKGSNTFGEWVDDILSGGNETTANIMTPALQALDRILADISADPEKAGLKDHTFAVGHSLGGEAAQTFALEALARPIGGDVVVNTYYFDSLPISSDLLTRDIIPDLQQRGLQVASASDAVAYYHTLGGNSQGIYYSGEIADFKFRTVDKGSYLNTQLAEVPSNTNGFATAALIIGARFSGVFGALAAFLGVKGNAHRMALLNAAMQRMSVDSVTGDLTAPNSSQPDSIPAGSQASVNTTDASGNVTSLKLSNGFVAEMKADGSLIASKTDADGNLIEQQTYDTTQDADGAYGIHWAREWYDAKGRFITDDVQQSGTGNVMVRRSITIQGVENVQLAQYEADWNGTVVNASIPSVAAYANVFVAAKSAFDAQGLAPVEEVAKLAAFATELGQAELDLGNRLGVSPNVLRANLAVASEGLAKSIANAYDGFSAKYSIRCSTGARR